MVEVLDLCLWTMSTALDGKDGCGKGVLTMLTPLGALTIMMLEFNVHQVLFMLGAARVKVLDMITCSFTNMCHLQLAVPMINSN